MFFSDSVQILRRQCCQVAFSYSDTHQQHYGKSKSYSTIWLPWNKLNYFVSESSLSGTSIIGLNERQILPRGCDNTRASLWHCDPKMVETGAHQWFGREPRAVMFCGVVWKTVKYQRHISRRSTFLERIMPKRGLCHHNFFPSPRIPENSHLEWG